MRERWEALALRLNILADDEECYKMRVWTDFG